MNYFLGELLFLLYLRLMINNFNVDNKTSGYQLYNIPL